MFETSVDFFSHAFFYCFVQMSVLSLRPDNGEAAAERRRARHVRGKFNDFFKKNIYHVVLTGGNGERARARG